MKVMNFYDKNFAKYFVWMRVIMCVNRLCYAGTLSEVYSI
jgi:hypothetical protein